MLFILKQMKEKFHHLIVYFIPFLMFLNTWLIAFLRKVTFLGHRKKGAQLFPQSHFQPGAKNVQFMAERNYLT